MDVDIAPYSRHADPTVTMDIIVKTFFSNDDTFVRELISNSVNALNSFHYSSLFEPSNFNSHSDMRINILLNKLERKLVITDTGVGMTKSILANKLCAVNKPEVQHFIQTLLSGSDTSDMERPGLGFCSVFFVAEKVMITTKTNDERQLNCEVTTAGCIRICESEEESFERGTTITIILKKEKSMYLDKHRMRNLIKKHYHCLRYSIRIATEKKYTIKKSDIFRKTGEVEEETFKKSFLSPTGHAPSLFGHSSFAADALQESDSSSSDSESSEDEDLEEILRAPTSWQPVSADVPVRKVPLQPSDKEYTTVERLLADCHPKSSFFARMRNYLTRSDKERNVEVIGVLKIENLSLHQSYAVLKHQMIQRNGAGIQNEILAFHGTSPEAAERICLYGFNRSLCGKNGTEYGYGVYMARDPSYSTDKKFATVDSEGVQILLCAKVLVGRFAAGTPRLVEPPALPVGEGRYDSVVDNTEKPNVCVVFQDNQAYPEYLIMFRTI